LHAEFSDGDGLEGASLRIGFHHGGDLHHRPDAREDELPPDGSRADLSQR
jgi:hypothetical protein